MEVQNLYYLYLNIELCENCLAYAFFFEFAFIDLVAHLFVVRKLSCLTPETRS
jgi:hypothetical protein